MKKKEELLEQIINFNEIYNNGWCGNEIDPYLRGNNFELVDDVYFPDEKGVYMFESTESGGYYIGQAKISLLTRLTNKVKNDIKEKRVENFRDDTGKLFHDYPYLPIYDEEVTTVYYLETPSIEKASVAERIIISAYYIKHNTLPLGNRTGVPAFAKLKEQEAIEALEEIAENFDL